MLTAEDFYKELKRIILSLPKVPTRAVYSENSDWGDQLYYCKNLMNCFDNVNCRDCVNLFDSAMCVNCIDNDYLTECDLCYESVDSYKCFNSNYLDTCVSVRDSEYCYNCVNCHDVFGCTNLRDKSFCIFNRQLSESEYKQRIERLKKIPTEQLLKFVGALKKYYPLTQSSGSFNENCPYGNHINYSKNCYFCFDSSYGTDSAYLFDTIRSSTSLDASFSGDCELSYEFIDSGHLFNCTFAVYSERCNDCSYIFGCVGVRNSIGCVNLSHKQYCILNRQYSKEDYEKIAPILTEELKAKNLGWEEIVF